MAAAAQAAADLQGLRDCLIVCGLRIAEEEPEEEPEEDLSSRV